MSDMYSKPGHGNSRFLYDGNGNVIGRGVTDSSGKTIYTGTDGQYIGKSYDMPSGTTKYVNANNEYVGRGFSHSVGVSKIDCVSDGNSTENGTAQSGNTYHFTGNSPYVGFPSRKTPILDAIAKVWLIASWIFYIVVGTIIVSFVARLIFL